MRVSLRYLLSVCIGLAVGGCSAMVHDGPTRVQVETAIDSTRVTNGAATHLVSPGARVTLDGAGPWSVTAPGTDTARLVVDRRFRRATLLNLANPVGWVLDFASGSAYTLEPRPRTVVLHPLRPAVAEPLPPELTPLLMRRLAAAADSLGCVSQLSEYWRGVAADLERGHAEPTPAQRAAADSLVDHARAELVATCVRSNEVVDSLRTAESRLAEVDDELDGPVLFRFGSAAVADSASARLARLARSLPPGTVLVLEGYTDPAGSSRTNYALGLRRAESVRRALLAAGLESSCCTAVSYGEDPARIVVPGAAASQPGAELNRRVVLRLLVP